MEGAACSAYSPNGKLQLRRRARFPHTSVEWWAPPLKQSPRTSSPAGVMCMPSLPTQSLQ